MTAKVREEDPDDPTPSIPLAGAVILLQAITASQGHSASEEGGSS